MVIKIFRTNVLALICFWLILCIILPTISFGEHIIWSADNETGDLSQWEADGPYGSRGGSYDNGDCIRPPNGVTSELSHSGQYSVKMSLGSWAPDGGCRQFRHAESTSGKTFYYSAWLYYPDHYIVDNWTSVIQFKSESPTRNDSVWALELRNRGSGAMYLMLRWKGIMAGPTEGEGTGLKHYHQTLMDVPAGQWFHVEVYLRQSSEYTGRITVWQNGVQIYDMDNVKTKYPDGDNRWSINAYGDEISPMPFTVYVDDAVVSTSRIGPFVPPVADAGEDHQSLTDVDGDGQETVTLDGSLSYDPDGMIVSYEWQADGVILGTIAMVTADFSLGSHTVILTVRDDQGATDMDTILVNVTSQSVRVSSSLDDAEECVDSQSMYLNSSDLELVSSNSLGCLGPQIVGMRFQQVLIPPGATIVQAMLQFTVDESDWGSTDLVIRGEAVDDALGFSPVSGNISSRSVTGASVSWLDVPDWSGEGSSGPLQQSPDLSSIVQEIVDRPGWSSGNALVLMVTGVGERTAESYDGSTPQHAPLLEIVWDPANPLPDTEDPTAPTNLVATAQTETQIDLTWTAATDDVGITKYRIYRNDFTVGNEIAEVGAVTSYSDTTGLIEGTSYTYKVSAVDAANNEGAQSEPVTESTIADTDADGVIDDNDNCPNIPNPDQADSDGDGIGDVCDTTPLPDTDGDGIPDASDNCPNTPNADQADADGDGIGDVCEADTDVDGVIDDNDNCPNIPNPDQADSDGDGIGDVCDTTPLPDTDGDGISDASDNCPNTPNADQADADGDGIGDVCEADTAKPTIYSANVSSPTTVDIVFSERLEVSSATNVDNYTIDNAIIVLFASLGFDQKTVTLTTSEHVDDVTYILSVNNIMDLASPPNVIVPNTTASYIFMNPLVISNIVVESGRAYEIVDNGLWNGELAYIDKNYTYSIVPTLLEGATYIKTAHADRQSNAVSFLTFDVDQDVVVYVAHDNRITTKPSWLTSFTDIGNDLVITNTTLSVFANNFLAGTITLGGNEGKGNRSMYTVIIVKYDGGSGCTDADGDGVCVEHGDCDDTNDAIYPGATEISYDSIDQDCDGSDLVDVDGDGYAAEVAGGDDCNDNDPDIHPGHRDKGRPWGKDGLDNDCNGIIDG